MDYSSSNLSFVTGGQDSFNNYFVSFFVYISLLSSLLEIFLPTSG